MSDDRRAHDVVGDLRHYGVWLRDRTTVTLAPPLTPAGPAGEPRRGPDTAQSEPNGPDLLDDLDRVPPPPLPRLIPIGLTTAAVIAAVGLLLIVVSGGGPGGDVDGRPPVLPVSVVSDTPELPADPADGAPPQSRP